MFQGLHDPIALGLHQRHVPVLLEILTGATDAEIASHLWLSKRTVEHYTADILEAYGCRRRVELIVRSTREVG